MLGKPVIRGTRIPVELILRKLSEGATETDLLDAYPRHPARIFRPPCDTLPMRSPTRKWYLSPDLARIGISACAFWPTRAAISLVVRALCDAGHDVTAIAD